MEKQKKPKNKNSGLNNFIRFSNLGFEMLGIMAFFIFLGFKLDQWLNLNRVFIAIFTIFSVFAALYYALRKIK